MVASVSLTRSAPAPDRPRRRQAIRARYAWWAILARCSRLAHRLARTNLVAFQWMARNAGAVGDRLSAPAAVAAARHAMRSVPAYAEMHLQAQGCDDRHPPTQPARSAVNWMSRLPMTSKHTYIDRWSLAERCVGGRIPTHGCELDESAGSTGVPYTWVRGRPELVDVHRTLALLSRHLTPADGRPVVVVNAFSMGAWATGTNVAAALRSIGTVKSCGPDIDKALGTITLLGPEPRYIVCGYPPFLRALLDAAQARHLDLSGLSMYGFVGGEGMTEAARSRLERTFTRVWSAYGASDLDIGVASETPLSVWIRQQAAARPELAQALFGRTDRLPMVFQYDPCDYFVEAVPDGKGAAELVVTVTRPTLSPRIRYNVGDEGGTIGFRAALAACRAVGLDPAEADSRPFRLPFLFVHGRSDQTLSFMGANLYPEDIAMGISDHPQADRLGAFCMELVDVGGGEVRPIIHVEGPAGWGDGPDGCRDCNLAGGHNCSLADCHNLAGGHNCAGGRNCADCHNLACDLAGAIRLRLERSSADYRAALAETPAAGDLRVRVWAPATGPFADNARRIKHRHVLTPSAAQAPDGRPPI